MTQLSTCGKCRRVDRRKKNRCRKHKAALLSGECMPGCMVKKNLFIPTSVAEIGETTDFSHTTYIHILHVLKLCYSAVQCSVSHVIH